MCVLVGVAGGKFARFSVTRLIEALLQAGRGRIVLMKGFFLFFRLENFNMVLKKYIKFFEFFVKL